MKMVNSLYHEWENRFNGFYGFYGFYRFNGFLI